ncbi:MAG TPA: polyketide cyclase, partial [Parvularcula sp.]|nr:polyketide cyclase [Parvularcula sp.]
MTDLAETAMRFFESCEGGKGWAACAAYCAPEATFSSQAEPIAEISSLKDYAEWMKGLLVAIPDGSYEIKAFAVDEARSTAVAYAVFNGTHTGAGGPQPPTGKRASSDYVYAMEFEGGKIRH